MENKITLYTEILTIEPNSKVFFPLARLLAEAGRHDDAVAVLERGLGFHPDHLEAKFLLIEILASQGREEKACEAFGDVGTLLARYPAVWQLWSKLVHGQAKDPSLAMLFLARYFADRTLTWADVVEKGLRLESPAAAPEPYRVPAVSARLAEATLDVPAAGPEELEPSVDAEASGAPPLRGAREVRELAALLEAPEEVGDKGRGRSSRLKESGVRTKTMAALLAEQGDVAGAMEIYNELLAAAASEAEREEISSLVEALPPAKSAVPAQPEASQTTSSGEAVPAEDAAAKPRSAAKLVNILEALAGRLEARAGQ